jgi:hypothetical protein
LYFTPQYVQFYMYQEPNIKVPLLLFAVPIKVDVDNVHYTLFMTFMVRTRKPSGAVVKC